MSCEIQNVTGPTVIHDHQSCIACRVDAATNTIEPLLTPGVAYPKCALLVRPVDACEPLTLLADPVAEKDRIVAVTSCDIDLTEVTDADNVPCRVLTNVVVDPNYLCWPEGTTADAIDVLVRNAKSCITYMRRAHCTPVPEELRYLLETKAVATAKAGVKTSARVPVAPSDTASDATVDPPADDAA